jgi:hypothetical protein
MISVMGEEAGNGGVVIISSEMLARPLRRLAISYHVREICLPKTKIDEALPVADYQISN